MSRAGRGGRGRGGFGRGGKQRIGGQEVGWDYDPELEKAINSKPQDLFPTLDIPRLNPPTRDERKTLAAFMAVRERIHRGPLYAVQGADFRVGKTRQPQAARFNPFDGMRSYSFKYKQPQRHLPNFSTRKYGSKVLPAELLDVVDPSKARASRGKAKQADRVTKLNDLDEEEEGEDAEGNEEGRDADEEAEEKDMDEDFSDDDSDMAGDYNAEAYFDGGDDDADEADGGGDDGGDYE